MSLFSSNFFNQELNWTGLLVELGPKNFAQLQNNRPKELAVVHGAVCDEEKIVHYYERGSVGGIAEFVSEKHKKIHWGGDNVKLQEIKCSPLSNIITRHVGDPFFFDFFSLDIEGAEFEALRSLDFNRVGFGIILIECDGTNVLKNMAVRAFLTSKGYQFIDDRARSCWFVHPDFADIYLDVLH